jgi:hypothetical protein
MQSLYEKESRVGQDVLDDWWLQDGRDDLQLTAATLGAMHHR